MILYLFIAALAFSLAGDNVYFLMIHAARALWAFTLYNFIIYERYNRKPVILYPDEKEILRQLNDNKLLKEIEYNNYSERTIRRRLEAARARNGVKTNDDLKELYNKTYNNN